VDVYGAHVPLSGWTAIVLMVGVALSTLLWRPLASRHGWRPGWTLATLLSVAVVLSLTLAPEGDARTAGLRACIPPRGSNLGFVMFHNGDGDGLVADLLNVLLTLPMTLNLVVATRRVRPALVSTALVPLWIELTQTLIPGRFCEVADFVSNAAGGLLGVAFGWFLHREMSRRA
jgi:VanZ family protein